MRGKVKFNIGTMTVPATEDRPELVTPPVNIEVAYDYNVSEIRDLYELQKIVLKEAPELFTQYISALKEASESFMKASEEVYQNTHSAAKETGMEPNEGCSI